MRCHEIMTWCNGEHDEPFYILCEDDYAFRHALETIMKSSVIDYFTVDGNDGPELFKMLDDRLYGKIRNLSRRGRNEGT